MGIPIAFHDLETDKQLQFMKEYGIHIAEFPLLSDISASAAADGFFNVVGAPNILKKVHITKMYRPLSC